MAGESPRPPLRGRFGTDYVTFPKRPPFDDERLRKALAHGLDRGILVEGTTAQAARGGFFPPAMPGHSHDLAPTHDPARPRGASSPAGYPDGRGLPELRLVHPDLPFDEAFRRPAVAAGEQLRAGWNRRLGRRTLIAWWRASSAVGRTQQMRDSATTAPRR